MAKDSQSRSYFASRESLRRHAARVPVVSCGLLFIVVLGWPWPAIPADDDLAKLRIASMPGNQIAAPFNMPALEGGRVASDAFAGKVLVLNFWATWCGPCKEEMPAFERLRRALDPEKVAVVTVTTDLQRTGIRHFLRSLDVQLPVLFDEDHEVSRAYMVRALPTTVIVDGAGHVVGRAVGPRPWDSAQAVALMRRLAGSSE